MIASCCKDEKIKQAAYRDYLKLECKSNFNQFILIGKSILSENFKYYSEITGKFCEALIEF
jgi:hypothetical protein